MNNETIKLALTYSLASELHEKWRETRKRNDGSYEPRVKTTIDEKWKMKHGNEVDIANCTFQELPKDWQYENIEAANVAIELVFEKTMLYEPMSFMELEEMASIVHDEWLKRNKWVYDKIYGNKELALPYSKLSIDEQDKDKNQIIDAQRKVYQYLNGLIDIDEICENYNIKSNKDLVKKV